MFVLCRPQTQIHDLKQAQNPSSIQLRSTLLDPAVNLLFQRMKTDLDSEKEKLEQAQNDLSAWKFTPDRWWKFFQKSAYSSKDPTKTESKLNKKQPCLTHKIFLVGLVVSDSYLVCCTLHIEEQWITYHCIRGNNCYFSLGIPFSRTDRAHFLVVLFLSNLTRLTDVALATTSEVPVPFLIGQCKSECLRIQTNVCEDLPETALVPLTAL